MLSFNLGPLAISGGQALVIGALLVALAVGKLAARRRDVPIADALFALALVGFVVARIAFVGRYFSSYGLDPLAWVDIRDGGFEVLAGLIAMGFHASYLGARQAALRAPLGAALFAGALTWGLTGGALRLIDNQAKQPPALALYTLDGQTTDLVALQQRQGNQPMIVNLWASWCPPCRAEMPLLARAQKQRPNVLFVFVNQAESEPAIRRFMDRARLDIDHVLRDRRRGIARQTGSAALPTTLFYNADGRLVDSHLGPLSKATLARALERFSPAATGDGQDSAGLPRGLALRIKSATGAR